MIAPIRLTPDPSRSRHIHPEPMACIRDGARNVPSPYRQYTHFSLGSMSILFLPSSRLRDGGENDLTNPIGAAHFRQLSKKNTRSRSASALLPAQSPRSAQAAEAASTDGQENDNSTVEPARSETPEIPALAPAHPIDDDEITELTDIIVDSRKVNAKAKALEDLLSALRGQPLVVRVLHAYVGKSYDQNPFHHLSSKMFGACFGYCRQRVYNDVLISSRSEVLAGYPEGTQQAELDLLPIEGDWNDGLETLHYREETVPPGSIVNVSDECESTSKTVYTTTAIPSDRKFRVRMTLQILDEDRLTKDIQTRWAAVTGSAIDTASSMYPGLRTMKTLLQRYTQRGLRSVSQHLPNEDIIKCSIQFAVMDPSQNTSEAMSSADFLPVSGVYIVFNKQLDDATDWALFKHDSDLLVYKKKKPQGGEGEGDGEKGREKGAGSGRYAKTYAEARSLALAELGPEYSYVILEAKHDTDTPLVRRFAVARHLHEAREEAERSTAAARTPLRPSRLRSSASESVRRALSLNG